MPAKLVVSSNKKKQLVVQLESAAGKTLLSAGPFTDKRSVAGLRRTLKTVLSDSVVYEDRTAKVATGRLSSGARTQGGGRGQAGQRRRSTDRRPAPATKTRRPRKTAAK